MQNKSNIILIIIFFLNHFFLNLTSYAEEFNISAKEISFDKEKNTVIAKGSVKVVDETGNIILSNKAVYEKSKEFLYAEGSVKVIGIEGNVLTTEVVTYDQKKNIIVAKDNTNFKLKEGYNVVTNNISYYILKKIIASNVDSVLTDEDGNTVNVTMFQYDIDKSLFSSVGKIKIIDSEKNKYFFKELHVDTKRKEMIGSDVSVLFDQENFGLTNESDPRFVANDILVTENKSVLSKGVFTSCKKRGEKCPPWVLQAKKIEHDKAKKTIYYENAILKVYDIPIFYFPRFFHPDPTVKRQSGFLTPSFTNSTNLGFGTQLPYYWAISHDKDLTFTPKIYGSENMLYLNEYRHAFKNAFLTLDTSYTEGYKSTSTTKTGGSRNHLFAELDINLAPDENFDSNLSLKIQRSSNDTYFRVHNIKTALVDYNNTDLNNILNYSFAKNDMYLNLSATVYENLREETNKRYEYVLPNILYGKSFFTESFGTLNFKSNAIYRNYDVNKHTHILTNDIIWSPTNFITKNGFINTLEAMVKNTNYQANNTTDYKNDGTINELSSVLSFKTSLPMKKEGSGFFNIFSPNFMVRYAPGHMKNLGTNDTTLKYANLYTTNKTSEIEDGISAILGFDFKTNEKKEDGTDREKLSISMGQVFSPEKNKDMPSKSSLDQKMSDVVGEINYNFSEIGAINYKFNLDHNFNDLNYNEVSTTLNFGKIGFNLDYLEENKHIGTEHYVNSGINLNINDQSRLSFSTKKNFKTDSTELYDLKYQYAIDCLTAGLVYRREFYEDSDVNEKDSLMFTITFVPFAGVKTPFINP